MQGNAGTFKRERRDSAVDTKTRDSFQAKDILEIEALQQIQGFDHFDDDDPDAKQPDVTDLSVRDQIWSINIFAFLCSLGLYSCFLLIDSQYFVLCLLSPFLKHRFDDQRTDTVQGDNGYHLFLFLFHHHHHHRRRRGI